MATTVTQKGQVTIPKRVRDLLAIKPGSRVDFQMAGDGNVILVKADGGRAASRFESLRGRAGIGMSTDEIMALTRGEP
ncbi:MAG TPA: AbrB/MazE/SpoVT family DNA-binding domain-containing protein [Caulobacteraceae bacterium]|nr:AbrB/MazE/SpoVT family DNA-binding domain-containing protein [Caulobacteraceae bacterium]